MKKHLLLFSLLFLFSLQNFAQTGSIRGFVYDKETGEPILFTNVYLKGTTYGAATDVNGYYSISNVPIGNYTILVSSIGFDTMSVSISLKAGEIVTRQLTIKKSSIDLQGVEISAEKEAARTEVRTSVNKVTPREIKMVPSVGGEPDLAQYLQVLPGVVFSGDQGGQLYIRGGTPVMNKVLLDGMVVYNPFHSIGLFSVFDADIIRNADVYTGGFSAEYGGRISSVMDITTRDGNKKRIAGKVSANPFTSKLLVEGPLQKQKTENGGGSSFILSAKNSYLDQTSPKLYSYIDEKGLPYSFQDLYGKITMYGSNGSKISMFGFQFQDDANYRFLTDNSWKTSGGGFNFILVPGGSSNLIDGNFAFSKYKISQSEAEQIPRTSSVNGFNFDMNFTNFMGKNELKYGFQVLGFKTSFETYNILKVKAEQAENTTEFGCFVRYRIVKNKFVIEPSIRLHYYASLAEFSPEPRIGFKYNISDKLRFKLGGGMYAQNLLSSVSDRDVVNIFYGFLSGPENLPDEFQGKDVNSRLQRSRDVVAGVEVDLAKHLSLNLEVYYKDFYQLTNVNRDKIYPDNGTYDDKPDYLVKDFIIEKGVAKGGDVVLKYDHRRFYLWLVYTLGFVTREDEIRSYTPHFDRRHNLNFVGSYTMGKKLDWEFNVRWNYGSGFPFTKTAGFYEYLTFNDGLFTDITADNGELGIIYGELNAGRLPDYHRMDVSLKKTFLVGRHSNLEVTASVVNIYNRQNIFYFDRIRFKRVDQLPILPAVGASLTF
jgi:CarboxypepD_reg-like domain/TonB-dependent Receptor Plug Domain